MLFDLWEANNDDREISLAQIHVYIHHRLTLIHM
jgi:hypothetical protein